MHASKPAVLLALLAATPALAADPPPPAAASSAAPAPAPAAPAERPLPYVAVVPFSAAPGVKPPMQHLGTLLAVALEQSVLQTQVANVVTQGAQAEMLDDMGIKPGAPLNEDTAKKLAQLSGATHVLFGTYEPAEKDTATYKVRTYGVLTGAARDLVTVTAAPADAAARLTEALARELAVDALPVPVIPSTEKAQRGYAQCVSFTAVALERAGVKGRKVVPAKNVMAACKDAASDKGSALGQGVLLSARLLTGDAKAVPDLQKHVDNNPQDRLAALVLLRRLFEDNKFEDASALLKKTTATRPRDPDILRMAGELDIQKDSWDSARRFFQQAVNQAPNSPYLRYRLSYASYRTDESKDALEHARAALRLAGGEAPFYQLNLGERLLDAGQAQEAALQLERSVKQTPNRVTPRLRLGYAYLLMGDADASLRELQAAQKLPATEREKERGVDLLLKADLARAHALKGNTKDALKLLKELEKAGALEKPDLAVKEFDALRETPEFKKLKAR